MFGYMVMHHHILYYTCYCEEGDELDIKKRAAVMFVKKSPASVACVLRYPPNRFCCVLV